MHPRILLLNPPTEGVKNTVRDLLYGCWCSGKRIAGATFPPLSLLSIYTILKKNSNPFLLDHQIVKWDINKFLDIVSKFEGLIMPVSDESISEDIRLLKLVKEKNPDIKTLVFGSYCTFFPEDALHHNEIDSIAIGEPESCIHIFPEIIQNRINKQEDIPTGMGLKFNNQIVIHEPKFDYQLDKLPIPDRQPIKDIYYFNPLTITNKWTTALTSRGCPGTCNFCTSPAFYGKHYRYHSFEWIKEELQYLKNIGFKEIFYRDETFTANRNRLHQFSDWITKEKIDIKWIINVRVGTVNQNDLIALKRAGCHTIKVGVESGSDRILKLVSKGTTVEINTKARKLALKYGIRFKAFIVVGLPYSTREDEAMTEKWIEENRPDDIDVTPNTPYPSTPEYENPEKYGLRFEYDFFGESVSFKYDPKKIKVFCENSFLTKKEIKDITLRLLKKYKI